MCFLFSVSGGCQPPGHAEHGGPDGQAGEDEGPQGPACRVLKGESRREPGDTGAGAEPGRRGCQVAGRIMAGGCWGVGS
jgi:hypothetical protein